MDLRSIVDLPKNYLAIQQLLVFDDRQLVTGLPGTMFEELRRTQNSIVNAKRQTVYTGSSPLVE